MTRAKKRKLARQAAEFARVQAMPDKQRRKAIAARKQNGGKSYRGGEFGTHGMPR